MGAEDVAGRTLSTMCSCCRRHHAGPEVMQGPLHPKGPDRPESARFSARPHACGAVPARRKEGPCPSEHLVAELVVYRLYALAHLAADAAEAIAEALRAIDDPTLRHHLL